MIDLLAAKRKLLPLGMIYKGGANAAARAQENAAKAQEQMSREALQWQQQVYEQERPARERAQALAEDVANQQLASSKLQDSISQDYWGYQKNTFRPLETGIVADAQNYDTTARRQEAADAAVADVNQQVSAQRVATSRELARSGVSPEASKALAISEAGDIGAAKAAAGAAYTARQGVETQGWARKMDAASLGRNLASSQATSAQIASQIGSNAASTAASGIDLGQRATAGVTQGYSQAISGLGQVASTYGSILASKTAQNQAEMAMIGQLAGSAGQAAGAMYGKPPTQPTSDKNAKKNIRSVSDDQALDQVAAVNSQKEWDYKDGAGDGGHHTGPMAQDVNRVMGEQAAPGGKVIDLVTLNGKNMAAIRALNKKVDRIAAKIGV